MSINPSLISNSYHVFPSCLVDPFNPEEEDKKIAAIVAFFFPKEEICSLVVDYSSSRFEEPQILGELPKIGFHKLTMEEQGRYYNFDTRLLYPQNWIPENTSEEETFIIASDNAIVGEVEEDGYASDVGDGKSGLFAVAFSGQLRPDTLFAAYTIFYNLVMENGLTGQETTPTPIGEIRGTKGWQQMEQALWGRLLTEKYVDEEVITYPNGNTYQGDLENNQRHGYGVLTWSDGGRYEGYWKKDQRCGKGTMTFPNGDTYKGDWNNKGQYHGWGLFTWSNGDRYDGNWQEGKRHGTGVMYDSNGRKEHGTWNNDRKFGY